MHLKESITHISHTNFTVYIFQRKNCLEMNAGKGKVEPMQKKHNLYTAPELLKPPCLAYAYFP